MVAIKTTGQNPWADEFLARIPHTPPGIGCMIVVVNMNTASPECGERDPGMDHSKARLPDGGQAQMILSPGMPSPLPQKDPDSYAPAGVRRMVLILLEKEHEELERLAKHSRLTASQWIRASIRAAMMLPGDVFEDVKTEQP